MSELTVKEYAQAERVTERTVWTWIAKGAIEVRRTPGGRVRIPSDRCLAVLSALKCSEGQGSSSE
jgi:excisionase family DNA binding protein